MPQQGEQQTGGDGQQQQQQAPPQQQAQNQPGQQQQNPGTQPGQKNGADDDKVKGLTRDLQGERTKRQELERKLAELNGTLTNEQKRVRALAGLETPSDEQVETDEIKSKLFAMFPQLKKLTDDKLLAAIEKLAGMSDTLERTTQHYWSKHGINSLQGIEKKISEAYGELTDRQIAKIRAAYVTQAENDPEFAKKHMEDPESLIESFSKEWIEDFFTPAERKVLSREVTRQRPVPGGKDRNIVTGPGEKKIDVTNDQELGDALVSGYVAKGGRFTGR